MLTMQGGDSLVGGLPIIHITYQQYIANPSAYHDPDVIVHISGFPTAGNLPADYVGYDSNLNMEDIGNIATKAIAKVEPSDTALYLHEVGTGFINKDGNYCITDVQIAVGGSIVLGTNCHVVDGGISGNLSQKASVSLLWSNPSPTSSFAGQTITLINDNYDMLLIVFRVYIGSDNVDSSSIILKGDGILLSANAPKTRYRYAVRQSDTSYTFSDGKLSNTYGNDEVNNNQCIPLRIYGIKL